MYLAMWEGRTYQRDDGGEFSHEFRGRLRELRDGSLVKS